MHANMLTRKIIRFRILYNQLFHYQLNYFSLNVPRDTQYYYSAAFQQRALQILFYWYILQSVYCSRRIRKIIGGSMHYGPYYRL